MTTRASVVAIDLGATSGRVVLGQVSATSLDMKVVARFPNRSQVSSDGLHWAITDLFAHAIDGLRKALVADPNIASIGVDSWAVDYGLLRDGALIAEPFHYRDDRTARGVAAVHRQIPPAELYRRNGLQHLPFNTLFQLAADRLDGRLDDVEQLLLIPDLLNFVLTGRGLAERTNASTTGLLRSDTGNWDLGLMDDLGLSRAIFGEVVDPGVVVGPLIDSFASGIEVATPPQIVTVGSHDTASAVAAVPMDPATSAYISCGTWGLVGVETEHPVLSDAAREANFTNEAGVDGRNRFLHNVMGLWLLSESVRHWEEAGHSIDLGQLLEQARAVRHPVAVFDPNDPEFMAPGDMPSRIEQHCRARGLPVPHSRADVARSIIESLAQAFADATVRAGALAGVDVQTIHIVGGGSLNELLCQRTADRSGLPVIAGPVEATAIGNLLVQARSLGVLGGGLEELRSLVGASTSTTRHIPTPHRP